MGAIFGPFNGPKFGHFPSKIRFSVLFFKTTYQICLKLGQKRGTIDLNHRIAVLCLEKCMCWPFWPFLGQNTLHVVTFLWFLGCFWSFSYKLLMVIFLYLNYVYGLGRINEKLSFNKKFGPLRAIEWG